MKRSRALIGLVLLWLFMQIANWAVNSWLDENVNAENAMWALKLSKQILDFVTGGFGIGFVLGAAVFSIWDWPVIGSWLQKLKKKFRNVDADISLANECDEISKYLYAQAAQLERVRSERHWEASSKASEDVHQAWIEARQNEAREEERIRREIGQRVNKAFVKLKSRGVRMDLWGFSLSHFDLNPASYFFAELADALRTGEYLEREFRAGRFGADFPARM